jgi:hypothetical protein
MAERRVRARLPVPRVRGTDGRLVVPQPVSRHEPWAPYDLVADVLRKDVDLDAGGGPYDWYDTSDDRERPGPFLHLLPVPIDVVWLQQHAALDVPVELRRPQTHGGDAFVLVLDGQFRVETRHDPDSARWRDAGWVTGAAWSRPPQRPGLLRRWRGAV